MLLKREKNQRTNSIGVIHTLELTINIGRTVK